MPENNSEVTNFSSQNRVIPINRNKEKKVSSKFNKPHCIIPVDDIQWVVNQVKTVQTLWNECWASDQYGSRWMKLTTSLSDKAFRLARQLLYTTGLFEFKRETCTDDNRKTACWLVKNLHGARRIQEFWMKDDQESAVNFDPISGINEPDISQKIPDIGQKMPGILPETPEKSSLPESLSNTSETSQELLKEVPDEVVMQELELVPQVPTLAPSFEEETTALILELRSRDTKKADLQASIHERCLRHYKQPKPNLGFKESFITTYNWRIDDQRFQILQNLTVECKRSFFEKFENMYGIYRKNLPEIFDRIISIVSSHAFNYQSD
ncbi:hypothetical protein [Nostoc sp.]|uniref:hypothetical protein n=1 Tax=Nostoc sp. TaxID=1180 RepID=UPI002FF75576